MQHIYAAYNMLEEFYEIKTVITLVITKLDSVSHHIYTKYMTRVN